MVSVLERQASDLEDMPSGDGRKHASGSTRRASRTEGLPLEYDVYPLTTIDGFVLRLFRSRPAPGTKGRAHPVLLLHGASSNRFSFGFRDDASLTGYLNRLGYDVWVLEFRGSKSSSYRGRGRAPQNLDAKIKIDLPLAIDHVLARTRAQKVDLIGHSLGGIFMYAFLGANPHAPVGRGVTFCAPAHVRRFLGGFSPALRIPARLLAPMASFLPGLGVDRLAKLPVPLLHAVVLNRHMHGGSMDRRARREYLDHAVEDMTGGDLSQLMRWFAEGGLNSGTGESYYDAFEHVRHPILLVGSDKDRIAEPDAIREAYRRLGTREKKLLFVGKRFGSSRNYAHQDLLLAPDASKDVYPLAHRWLTLG